MLQFEVKNLGPIVEGSVELRPLTIFTGKNNLGKSYFAMLIYAIFNTLTGGHLREWTPEVLFRDYDDDEPHIWFPPSPLNHQRWPAVTSWLQDIYGHSFVSESTEVQMPPKAVLKEYRDIVLEKMTERVESFSKGLGHELQRCYASKLKELNRKDTNNGAFSISVKSPTLSMNLISDGVVLKSSHPLIHIEDETIQSALCEAWKEIGGIRRGKRMMVFFTPGIRDLYNTLFFNLLKRAYYLPAARSGILQGHKALSSSLERAASLAGIEPLEIPQFSGVIGDFLSILHSLPRRTTSKLNNLAIWLEMNVARGDVITRFDQHRYQEIFYKSKAGKLALHRTSSMISEIAPLVLFLRYVIKPGDVLIIEEPEAHLHPENQRKLARVLVALVRTKVNVVVTTHSDYLVQQLSNFVALGGVEERERAKEGYQSQDYLNAEEVGAYLFRYDEAKGGSVVEEVVVSPEEGIHAEEFGKVAEELYEQSVTLQQKVLRDK